MLTTLACKWIPDNLNIYKKFANVRVSELAILEPLSKTPQGYHIRVNQKECLKVETHLILILDLF